MSGRVVGVSDDGKMLAGFFLYSAGIALFLIVIIARCFVISKMWGWYVAPFLSAPAMPLAVAFGFSLLVSYLTMRKTKSDPDWNFWKSSASVVGDGAFTLGIAWLGTWFLP